MRKIAGRLVFDSLEEILAPAHTALLTVDMQNDFCKREGVFAQEGADISRIMAAVPVMTAILDSARTHGAHRVFMRHTHEPDLSNLSPARLSFYAMLYGGSNPYHAIRGTWGHSIIDELEPRAGEAVIDKGRSSAFIGTSLDMFLRSNGIRTVVITGMATHACVESSARDAGFFDYYVVVARDGVADYRQDLHDASLLTLGQRVVLVDHREVLRCWSASPNDLGAAVECPPASGEILVQR